MVYLVLQIKIVYLLVLLKFFLHNVNRKTKALYLLISSSSFGGPLPAIYILNRYSTFEKDDRISSLSIYLKLLFT